MVRAPIPGATKRRCTCGCNTTSIKTMNKHMKEHSQLLNIKTMQLASMTAVFRSKKRAPPTTDEAPTTTMDMDEVAHPPEQDSQVGGSEVIPQELAVSNGNKTDSASSSNGNNETGRSLVDSDSGDEFESEEESADRMDEDREDWGTLEFELQAAKAGNVVHCIRRFKEQQIDLLNLQRGPP